MAAFLNTLLLLNKFSSFQCHLWGTQSNFTLIDPGSYYLMNTMKFTKIEAISYRVPKYTHTCGHTLIYTKDNLEFPRGFLRQCLKNWNIFLYHVFLTPIDQVFKLTHIDWSTWLQFNYLIKILHDFISPALVETTFSCFWSFKQ